MHHKKRITLVLITVLFLVFNIAKSESCVKPWGFFGHKRINRVAVFTLPPEMFGFFKKHIEFVTEHAVDPDKRRYAVDGEAPRHFIDIDHFVAPGEDPFPAMPRKWEDAVEKFSEDTLQEYGIVPWHIDVMVGRMETAFRNNDTDRILRTASDLGHYIADSHVPLHTTENYNGHMTGQKGIHGFWESRIPELFAEDYDFFIGKAAYVDDVLAMAWDEVENSHRAVDSVLTFERELSKEFSPDRKYTIETRGSATVQNYSKDFSRTYSDMMDDMVERRMRQSIISVGSLWYTAWVNAGQPDLDALGDQVISEEERERQKELDKKFNSGKTIEREHKH
jgi:hypothetical protein